MRRFLKAATATFLSLVFAFAVNAGPQDFKLVNATGVEIYRVYVSPAGASEWNDDILAEDTLPNGLTVAITFDANEQVALWDIRVEDDEGNSLEWYEVNLLTAHTVVLNNDGTANIME